MRTYVSGPTAGLEPWQVGRNFSEARRGITLSWMASGDTEDLVMFDPTQALDPDLSREDFVGQSLGVLLNEEWDWFVSIPGWDLDDDATLERDVADAIGITTIDFEDFVRHFLGGRAHVNARY